MAFQIGIGEIKGGIIDIGFKDSRLKIIQDYGSRQSPKELESTDMTRYSGGSVHTKDKPYETMTAIRKGHDKGPSLSFPLGHRIIHEACVAKIHLGLLTRRGLYPDRDFWGLKVKLPFQVSFHSAISYR